MFLSVQFKKILIIPLSCSTGTKCRPSAKVRLSTSEIPCLSLGFTFISYSQFIVVTQAIILTRMHIYF